MKRGDLVTVALQGDHGKPRPAIVMQSELFAANTSWVTVILLTSTPTHESRLLRIPVDPSPTSGLEHRSWAMIDQIYSARTNRVGRAFGQLSDDELQTVSRALALFLGIAT